MVFYVLIQCSADLDATEAKDTQQAIIIMKEIRTNFYCTFKKISDLSSLWHRRKHTPPIRSMIEKSEGLQCHHNNGVWGHISTDNIG